MERGLPNCFNSFATSTKRETVETVPTDQESRHQLKLGVNEKPLSNSLLQFTSRVAYGKQNGDTER